MTKNLTKSILFYCLILQNGLLNAQKIESYGLKLGINLSNAIFESEDTNPYSNSGFYDQKYRLEYKTGFSGQIFIEKKLIKYLSVRPSLGYIQKGYNHSDLYVISGKLTSYKVKQLMTLHNLSFDLCFKITPFEKKVKPYILIGVRNDYLLNSSNKIKTFNQYGSVVDNDDYFDDNFTLLNFGPILGIGVAYRDLFFLEFEYNPSFIDINKNNTQLNVNRKLKSEIFSLNLGINFKSLFKKNKNYINQNL